MFKEVLDVNAHTRLISQRNPITAICPKRDMIMREQIEVYPTWYPERPTSDVCLYVLVTRQRSNGISVTRMDAVKCAQSKRIQFKPQMTKHMTTHGQPWD
jgi:hypothetical protein